MMTDPITIEVIRGALIYAAEEMGIALRKSAYSPNIKERMDHSCALFDEGRRLVAQAEHIPVHLGSMALAVREGLNAYKGLLGPGDMILLNDPYLSGTHLPDLTLIAPIYSEGKLIGYAANKAHHTDVGGRAPGSLAGDSTELYQEGLIIPPVRLVKGGEMDQELVGLIGSNVRTPSVQMGDIRAQVAANSTGIRRVLDLVESYGARTLADAEEEIMGYSERRMRVAVSALPEGTYEGVDQMEDVPGRGVATIKVRVTIRGDSIEFDYTGTEPQVDAPINAPLGVTIAGIYFTLVTVTDPTIPVNDGSFRPITLCIPEGTMMNPRRPAPVAGGNVETSQRNVDALMRAFSKITPGRVPAAGPGTMSNVSAGGSRPDGTQWTFYETIGGGSGGRPTGDGVDGVHVNMTNTMNTPVEAMEAYLPIRFLCYGLRPDSGGPGEHRGGCGIERSWKLTSQRSTLSILAERTRIAPWGLAGGGEGAKGEYIIVRSNGERMVLSSKCTLTMYQGDVLVARTPGGGGYGDPRKRKPENVLADVLNGLVTVEAAERDYGVAVDDKTMSLDMYKTRLLREER